MDINEAKVVRYQNANGEPALTYYYEISGDSTETKPTANVADGSIFTETDTGDVYIYNAKGAEWNKMFGLSGGGAGQNKKSVITGTLATFADDFAELFGVSTLLDSLGVVLDFKKNNVSAVLKIDGTVLGVGTSYFNLVCDPDPENESGYLFAQAFLWQGDGNLTKGALLTLLYENDAYTVSAWMYQNGDGTNPTDIMQYAANIPYKLTVYYHPMS